MKNKLLFLFFVFLMQVSFASNKTIFTTEKNTHAIKEVHEKEPALKDRTSVTEEKKATPQKNRRKNTLSEEEKQRNFFMRTGLQIIATFVFLFVLFLVFRMKKK